MIQFSKKFKFLIVILTFAFCILDLNVYAVEYKLMIPIPGHGDLSPTSLAEYLQWLFVFIVAAAGILALLMIMIGGFQYITAGGNEARAGQGKSRIQNAIIGLILALCSYLILNTINPDLAELAHLPGLTPINPSSFTWDDYLKEFPKAGGGGHDLPDGAVCSSHADCYYSRICANDFYCPNDPLKKRYLTAPECYAIKDATGANLCDQNAGTDQPECTLEKTCEPLFDKDGYILNPETKAKASRAIGFSCETDKDCFDNGGYIGSKTLNIEAIPANPNIICNHAKNAICAKQNTYWQPCFDDGTECEGDLLCDTSLGDKKGFGLCNTLDGTPPSQKGEENGQQETAWGDKKSFYSIEPYSATTPKGTLFHFAIITYEYEWSGIQKCEKLGSGWKNAGDNKEKLCQIRRANKPEKLQTDNLKVTCDGKEKCTAYQWAETREGAGGTEQKCGIDWNQKKAEDCTGVTGDSLNGKRWCCTYNIVCCENQGSNISCNTLNNNSETGWQDAKGDNDAACMFGLKDIIFGADPWIARWYQVENPPLAKLSLPGKCCERALKEGEKSDEGWKKVK